MAKRPTQLGSIKGDAAIRGAPTGVFEDLYHFLVTSSWPALIGLIAATFTVANLVEHGDIDLPLRFERLMGYAFITPALHRRHHTKPGPERDTNFGTTFAIWDRLFGTRADSDSATTIETAMQRSPAEP